MVGKEEPNKGIVYVLLGATLYAVSRLDCSDQSQELHSETYFHTRTDKIDRNKFIASKKDVTSCQIFYENR